MLLSINVTRLANDFKLDHKFCMIPHCIGSLSISSERINSAPGRSPHVVHESERLWCGTAPTSLSPSELQELKEKHSGFAKAAVEQEGEDLAYFEVFTAMAFKHFQEQQVAYCTSHRSLSLTSSRGVREPTAPCSVGCTDKRPGRKESNSPIFSSCFHRLIGFAFFFLCPEG